MSTVTQNPAVTDLVKAIERMLENAAVPTTEYLTDGTCDCKHCTCCCCVREVADFYAPAALIEKDGHADFGAHAQLAAAGYPVHCGERDDFGWLTGVITTPKGLIAYG